MKILHISTFDYGGAGRAAIRLHVALLNAGVESNFLCLQKKTDIVNVHEYKYITPILKKILNKLRLNKLQKLQKELSVQQGIYETYTFPYTDIDISSHPLVKNADIINLHWISWFIDYSFFKKVHKPIVWTLHDKNPILGGFHYCIDKENNRWKLEERISEYKHGILINCSSINIVALNNWMLNYSKASDVFRNRNHSLIYNSIEADIFKLLDKLESRNNLELPQDIMILAFFSEAFTRINKGAKLIKDLIREFNNPNVLFCAIGEIQQLNLPNLKYLGNIEDDKKLASVYSAVDALIIPSIEDNLPNTMLESLSCGTPVIATPVGGMLDIITNGENGYLSDETTAESLKKAVMSFIGKKERFDRNKIRKFALNKFSQNLQAKKYLELYYKIASHS